jgi:hypothetical protein
MWPSETTLPPVRGNEAAARRHIRTVPTRLGVGLLVMVALLWLVGLNYQANLAYIAAFWLLGFIIVAVLQNRAQLLGLRLEVKMPSEIFAGTPAEITLDAAGNTRRRRLWLAQDDGDGWQPWHIPGGSASAVLPLQAQMRGYLRLPLLRVAAAAPFGICTTECRWQWQSDKVVFPAPEVHDPPAGFHADECGGVQAASARSSDDLSHLQAHQSGASLQHIAWKTYAKTGEMLDKKFEAAEAGGGSRIISYRDYPSAGREQLAALLCHRVLEAERRGIRYELELPGRTVAPQKSQREICLTALALW